MIGHIVGNELSLSPYPFPFRSLTKKIASTKKGPNYKKDGCRYKERESSKLLTAIHVFKTNTLPVSPLNKKALNKDRNP